MTFDPENLAPPGAKIKVIGVGGGGSNAVNTMIRSKLEGVDFIVCNTDVQALRFSLADTKIQVGKELTRGLGAGADPDIGRDAALEDRHEIQQFLDGADMVFITAGMGGGTGTGGAAVVAQIARELGALTVAVVTKPFGFEGKRRRKHAEAGIARLRECVDTLITIPNQRLLQVAAPDLSMIEAFKMADDVLVNAVRGISDIINIPGTVNVDFADVKTVMSCMGHALMGIGGAMGPSRAVEAAKKAICSPLLEDVDIEGATGILINITAGSDVTLMEVNEACSVVQEAAHEDANIIFGAVIDETLGDEIRVTVIATGFPVENQDSEAVEPVRTTPSIYARGLHSPGLISTKSGRPTQGASMLTQKREIVKPNTRLPEPSPRTEQPVAPAAPVSMQTPASVHVPPAQPMPQMPVAQTPVMPPQMPIVPLSSMPEPAFVSTPAAPAPFMTQQEMPSALVPEPQIDLSPSSSETEAQQLAAWTMDQSQQESETQDTYSSQFQGYSAEDSTFLYEQVEQFVATEEQIIDEPRADLQMGSEASDSIADGLFEAEGTDEAGDAIVDLGAQESVQPGHDRMGAQRLNAPLESFFDEGLDDIASDIDKRIDAALELAERMKRPASEKSDDDLDVPAFLRTGLKDLPLD
jgi:cell division protein FtsZ